MKIIVEHRKVCGKCEQRINPKPKYIRVNKEWCEFNFNHNPNLFFKDHGFNIWVDTNHKCRYCG